MNVAVRRVQHSARFGQRALSQIVSSPSSLTRLRVKYVPLELGMGRFSHSGKRRARPGLSEEAGDIAAA
jgi:hypothetical protein